MTKYREIRSQLHKIYDGAGVAETPDYDFKGNAIAQVRTYTGDATQHPDWTSIGSVNLETETYDTTTEYDALNRPVKLTTPDNGETTYTYDKGGLLKTVEVENIHSLDTEIVNNIEYDAKGQRTKVQYENGTTTTYEYDEFTFRVRRIRTTRHSDSKELQDLRYWYDPVGNVTLQKDLAQQTVYFDGSVAEPHNDYTYDALYRLIQAAGREHAGNNNAPDYSDSSKRGITPTPIDSTDTAKMRRYIQYYEYDEAGNFIQMRHTVTGGTGNWTRYYTTANDSNRLEETVVGSGTPEVYTFDARGNIVSGFAHLVGLAFNAENRLEKVEIDANRTAYYQYDSKGQRVRKTIVDTNSNIKEVRKYIGEWEVYTKYVSSTLTLERETLHINDDTGRIALIDTRTTGSGAEPAQLLRYQYSNHLQTATLELDDAGAIISYEEYYPYGSTSFQSGRSGAEVSLKRYRYTGKERDEESGLYYHGARYYIPWLARWTAVDMLQSEMPTWSSYNYGFDNPVRFTDPTGKSGEEKNTPQFKGGNDFPLEENYAPVSSTTKMTPDENGSFPYKWGGSVTKYHDDALDRDFSVLEQRSGSGEQRFFSWVNKETGKAEIFTGYNKDKAGEWTGRWVEFESAEKRNVRLAGEVADNLALGLNIAIVGMVTAPLALEAWSAKAAVNFSADLAYQFSKYGTDYKKYNLTSLTANASGLGWFTAPLVGSLGEFTLENEFKGSFVAGNKTLGQLALETTVSATFNKLGGAWMKGPFGSFGARREMYELFGRKGVERTFGSASFTTGYFGNVFGGAIIDLSKGKE